MLALNHKYLPYFMWLFPLSFFTYQFILRLWPGLMMQQIMEQFSIDASRFGQLAAFYYYGYAGMQIPVAIMLDRFGARYIVFIFANLCGVALLIFTYTNNFYLALFSRFLIGAGSAVGFLGISKILSEWFPKEQYARMIGFSFTIGLMGAIYGGRPISLLIEQYNWQNVAFVLAIISIIIGCFSYIALKSTGDEINDTEKKEYNKANFGAIISSPSIWYLAVANLLMVGSLEGFADIWGVPYLMIAYDLDKSNAAGLISFIFLGMLFGGPILSQCSKKFGNYSVIAVCGFGMAIAFTLLILLVTPNQLLLSSLFFLVGVMCCYQVIIFAAGADLVLSQNIGVTIAFLNCINMLGGSFFHTIIGNLMDIFWTSNTDNSGLKIYDLWIYKYSLSAVPVCSCLGAIMICLIWLKTKKDKL